MTAFSTPPMPPPKRKPIPPLEPGDRLDQATFHQRYEKMGPGVKAELIEGVVHLPSPVGTLHGDEHALMVLWLGNYFLATPGTKVSDNATVILSDTCEPQADISMRLLNGKTTSVRRGETEYINGPPEFMVEIASTSESIDLHGKRRDYERYGVAEYLAFLVRSREVIWFVRESDRFVELSPNGGLLKSRVFPGLWLDADALLRGDARRMQKMLNKGLATAGHAEFVESLAKPKSGGRKRK